MIETLKTALAVIYLYVDGIEPFVLLFAEQWLSAKERRPAMVGVLVSIASILLFSRNTFILPAMAMMILVLFALRRSIEGRS
jgi:predicted branched-subunit amino acid permease